MQDIENQGPTYTNYLNFRMQDSKQGSPNKKLRPKSQKAVGFASSKHTNIPSSKQQKFDDYKSNFMIGPPQTNSFAFKRPSTTINRKRGGKNVSSFDPNDASWLALGGKNRLIENEDESTMLSQLSLSE